MQFACDYLARVGFSYILGTHRHQPTDEDSQASIDEARLLDHDFVANQLLSRSPTQNPYGDGVKWLVDITWVDRVPALKTWAGQVTLARIIKKSQRILPTSGERDLFKMSETLQGTSGIDGLVCPDTLDVGFSTNALLIPTLQRPAIELLAIIGLETVPLISFAKDKCGFIHDQKVWRFPVESRTGGYFKRWGLLTQEDILRD